MLKVSFLDEDVLECGGQQFAQMWFHVCIDTLQVIKFLLIWVMH